MSGREQRPTADNAEEAVIHYIHVPFLLKRLLTLLRTRLLISSRVIARKRDTSGISCKIAGTSCETSFLRFRVLPIREYHWTA